MKCSATRLTARAEPSDQPAHPFVTAAAAPLPALFAIAHCTGRGAGVERAAQAVRSGGSTATQTGQAGRGGQRRSGSGSGSSSLINSSAAAS